MTKFPTLNLGKNLCNFEDYPLAKNNQWNRDWIERQLAHAESDSIRAVYNHAEYLLERKKMMQWWADWLDAQK